MTLWQSVRHICWHFCCALTASTAKLIRVFSSHIINCSPVKIDTLARNLIRLSGFKPDEDIKIEYTGLRPGEKLYEEKLMAEEGLQRTDNELIHIGNPIQFDEGHFLKQLVRLTEAAYGNKEEKIRELIKETVSTYHPAE